MRADYILNEDEMMDMRKDAGEGGGGREGMEVRKEGRNFKTGRIEAKAKRPVKIKCSRNGP
jgi:hypothetical protein